MPSDKRARQRALRELKVAQQTRQQLRTRRLRRGGGAVVVAGIIIGIIFAVSSGSPRNLATTTTLAASSTTTALRPASSAPSTTAAAAVAPTCPPTSAAGAAHRVITFTKAPPNCIPQSAVFDATITTDRGPFVLKMSAASSYAAVNDFVFLARYHFFDGITFHRVIPGFVVQGGDPTGTGTGGPGYSFTGNTPPSACAAKSNCYPLGAVAMANSGSPSSDGSQFFVVVGAAGEQLPPNYTLFGQVTSGMSVVNAIAADGASSGTPKVLHHMVKVTITELAA